MNRGATTIITGSQGIQAEEYPTHRQTRPAQDGGEGQKIPLCQVPETQPKARAASGAVVLPEVFGCDGRE